MLHKGSLQEPEGRLMVAGHNLDKDRDLNTETKQSQVVSHQQMLAFATMQCLLGSLHRWRSPLWRVELTEVHLSFQSTATSLNMALVIPWRGSGLGLFKPGFISTDVGTVGLTFDCVLYNFYLFVPVTTTVSFYRPQWGLKGPLIASKKNLPCRCKRTTNL